MHHFTMNLVTICPIFKTSIPTPKTPNKLNSYSIQVESSSYTEEWRNIVNNRCKFEIIILIL